MLEFDDNVHRLGEAVQPNQVLVQAAAWWVASELVRRHPAALLLTEEHPFMYDCIAVYRRASNADGVHLSIEDLVVYLNLIGHLTHGSWFSEGEPDLQFNWADVILSPDRRRYVIGQLEKIGGLQSPGKTPSTTKASIGPRLIAAFLGRTVFSRGSDQPAGDSFAVRWQVRSGDPRIGPFDRSAWYEFNDDLMKYEQSINGREGCRYWFLIENAEPVVALDVIDGAAWNSQRRFDLFDNYSSNGRLLDPIVNSVFPAVH